MWTVIFAADDEEYAVELIEKATDCIGAVYEDKLDELESRAE
jgi:hypothetical protein